MSKLLKWTDSENKFVAENVKKYGVAKGLKVSAFRLKNRTLGAVSFHYYNVISPKSTRINKAKNKTMRTKKRWNTNELKILNNNIKNYGVINGYKEASKKLNRSIEACKSRYKKSRINLIQPISKPTSLMEHKKENKSNNNTSKIQCYSNGKISKANIILQKNNLIVATNGDTILTIEI